jgi:hypothetical protein
MKLRGLAILCALTTGTGCGGLFSGDGDSGKDAATDVHADGLGVDPNCVAPSGVSICGGEHQCGAQCKNCAAVYPNQDAGELRPCGDANYSVVSADTGMCPDGALNACDGAWTSMCWFDRCVTEDLAQLYAKSSRPDLALYADRATYTGAPLPPPPGVCPSTPTDLHLCGGACGNCPNSTDACTGRSPLHPVSLCIPGPPKTAICQRNNQKTCTGLFSDHSCLVFKVDDAAQATADNSGFCVPTTLCTAAAAAYPGGVTCN